MGEDFLLGSDVEEKKIRFYPEARKKEKLRIGKHSFKLIKERMILD